MTYPLLVTIHFIPDALAAATPMALSSMTTQLMQIPQNHKMFDCRIVISFEQETNDAQVETLILEVSFIGSTNFSSQYQYVVMFSLEIGNAIPCRINS